MSRRRGSRSSVAAVAAPALDSASPPAAATRPFTVGGKWAGVLTFVELLAICCFVTWFYLPFLREGWPPGDFASDLMVATTEERLAPTPLDFPKWNPLVMCGRPEIGFWRPMRLFELPWAAIEPVRAQKLNVILFHVLAGLAMYALVRDSRGSRWAALFGGCIYPIVPAHIVRSALHGHVHVIRFYALIPLLLLSYFRLEGGGRRDVVVLGLVLAACLSTDGQRTLLVLVMLGILVVAEIVGRGIGIGGYQGSGAATRRVVWRLVSFALAFVIAVGICGFELINGFVADPYRSSFTEHQLATNVDIWAIDNLYSYVDRMNVYGDSLKVVSEHFTVSSSRYLGVSVVALLIVALLFSPGYRLWTAVALALLSVWLAAGRVAIGSETVVRWQTLWQRSDIDAWLKLVSVAAAVLALATATTIAARALPTRMRPAARWLVAIAVVGIGVGLLLFTAPYPLLRRAVFFLRDHRNPDWFQVAAVSTTVTFGAALGVSWIDAKLRARRWRVSLLLVILALAVADLYPYRLKLVEYQRSASAVAEFQRLATAIGADLEDFRVMPAKFYDNVADGLAIWHGKRLAWDFRDLAAPRRTRQLMSYLQWLAPQSQVGSDYAALAGLANVKYIAEAAPPSLYPHRDIELVERSTRLSVYRNRAYRPFVEAWPEVHLMVADDPNAAISLTGMLASRGIALIHAEGQLDPGLSQRCTQVWADRLAFAAGAAPSGAKRFADGDSIEVAEVPTPIMASLHYERPAPHRIRIETHAEQEFLLTVSESFHPWWEGRLDGQPLSLYPTSFAFVGGFVPAGQHVVELEFVRRGMYFVWLGVSLVVLVGCLAFLVIPRRTGGYASNP